MNQTVLLAMPAGALVAPATIDAVCARLHALEDDIVFWHDFDFEANDFWSSTLP